MGCQSSKGVGPNVSPLGLLKRVEEEWGPRSIAEAADCFEYYLEDYKCLVKVHLAPGNHFIQTSIYPDSDAPESVKAKEGKSDAFSKATFTVDSDNKACIQIQAVDVTSPWRPKAITKERFILIPRKEPQRLEIAIKFRDFARKCPSVTCDIGEYIAVVAGEKVWKLPDLFATMENYTHIEYGAAAQSCGCMGDPRLRCAFCGDENKGGGTVKFCPKCKDEGTTKCVHCDKPLRSMSLGGVVQQHTKAETAFICSSCRSKRKLADQQCVKCSATFAAYQGPALVLLGKAPPRLEHRAGCTDGVSCGRPSWQTRVSNEARHR
jgi:hypothetical protein